MYVAVVAVTIVALGLMSLGLMSWAGSSLATPEAWGHAVLVGAFAVLLPVRLRSAQRGEPRAIRAVGVIAAVLLAVNVVEAAIPGLFPTWMRVEMVAIAVLMAAVLTSVIRVRR